MGKRSGIGVVGLRSDYESKRRLEVITEVVSGKFGMPVCIYEVGITTAWYEKGKVCLSRKHLDELLSKVPDKCVKGVVYHEAGHAMLTDLDVLLAFKAKDGLKEVCRSQAEKEALHHVWNVLEDIRIEHAIAAKFDGVQMELKSFIERVMKSSPWLMDKESKVNKLLKSLYLVSRYPSLASEVVPLEIKEDLREFASWGERAKNAKDTRETFAMAIEMLKALRKYFKEPPKPKEPKPMKLKMESGKCPMKGEGEGEGAEEDEEGSEEGEGGGGGESVDSEGTEPKGGKGRKPKEEKEPKEKKFKEPKEKESKGGGDSEDADADDADADDAEGEEEGEEDTSPRGGKDEMRDLGEDPEDKPEDIGDMFGSDDSFKDEKSERIMGDSGGKFEGGIEGLDAADIIEALTSEKRAGRAAGIIGGTEKAKSIAIPSEFVSYFKADEMYPISEGVRDTESVYTGYDLRRFQHVLHEHRASVNTLVRHLKDLFILSKKGHYIGGYSSGQKVDVGVLPRVLTGNDKVFMKRFKESEADTAITVLLDLSSSMCSSGKIECAREAVIVLSEVLTSLNVPYEILGFSSRGAGGRGVEGVDEIRVDDIAHVVLKAYDEVLDNKVRARLGGIEVMSQNWDGEAILWAYQRAKKHQAKRKVIWVLSDGSPCGCSSYELNAKFTKRVIECVERKMSVIGIGFGSNHVKGYYQKSVFVKAIPELTVEFVKLLRKCLL